MKLSKILNALLTAAVAGLVALLLSRYYLPAAPSIAVGVAVPIWMFGGRDGKSKRRMKHESAVRTALLTMPAEARRKFLFDALAVRTGAVIDGETATLEKDGETLILLDKTRYAPLSGDEVVEACAAYKKPYILCDAFDKNAGEAAAALGATLVHGRQIYEMLSRLRAYPKIKKLPKQRGHWKRLGRAALHPSRFKGYLLTAFVLATTGFLTPYRIYYLIFAALACVLAATAVADPFHARARRSR